MRVIIGGAYHGKKAFVKKLLVEEGRTDVQWSLGKLPIAGDTPVVVADLERWLEHFEGDEDLANQLVRKALENRESIVILTDIGRGIVPMEPEIRALRDCCGRLYQNIIQAADEVIQVWYGIPKIIKKGEK